MYNPSIGIVGVGWIGAQFKRYFEEVRGHARGRDLFLYDSDIKKNYFDDVSRADVTFICVPTPRNPKDGSCDTSFVRDAISRAVNGTEGKVVVIKSTVPPGTTQAFQRAHPKAKLLFSPEFLTESRAWEDFMRPDRQIVGFTDESLDAAHLVLSLLPKAPFMSPWGTGGHQKTRITATEAELIKYACNVYLARKVNLANAIAATSEKLGADYENVRRGMSADHRIGDSHLDVNHGGYRGFGGFCLPKDLDAFIRFAKSVGVADGAKLLEADRKFNEELLQSQGLSLDQVSRHIDVLDEIVKKSKRT